MKNAIIYLFLLQTLAVLPFMIRDGRDRYINRILVSQVLLLVIFFLVWGGYSTDAWRYLWRFEKNPFTVDPDRLFWIAGHYLSRVIDNPWPLKISSVISILLMIVALLSWHTIESKRRALVAMFLLPLLPVFFLGYGNTVRQVMAGSLFLLAFVTYKPERRYWMYILSAMAILIHYPIIALFIAVYLANRWPSAAPAFLISAIVLGFGAPWVLNIFGFELAAIVKYSGYTEGSYHYLKLAVHLVVAGFILILVRFVLHRKLVLFESVYLYCVGVASLLVLYEVPFERLLLYGEMIIPFMLPGLLLVERLSARAMIGLWATGMVLGILLWTNRSIEITLGYAT